MSCVGPSRDERGRDLSPPPPPPFILRMSETRSAGDPPCARFGRFALDGGGGGGGASDYDHAPARAPARAPAPPAPAAAVAAPLMTKKTAAAADNAADRCCSYCGNARPVGKRLRCGRCKQAVYCSKACQKKDWRAGHGAVCRSPESIRRTLQLFDRSSERWLTFLKLKERLRLAIVSTSCKAMLCHAAHCFQNIDISGRSDVGDASLQWMLRLAGNQLRSMRLTHLPNISGAGLALLQAQPNLESVIVRSCENVPGASLLDNFFTRFRHRKLTRICFRGSGAMTKPELDAMFEHRLIDVDMFACQVCAKVFPNDSQAQCRGRHCGGQPSTLAVCSTCADTEKCCGVTDTCQRYFCTTCADDYEDWAECDACGNMACEDCLAVVFCDDCSGNWCEECKLFSCCGDCSACTCEDCSFMPSCDDCGEDYCEDCRLVLCCDKCDKASCAECQEITVCNKCDGAFCESCELCWHCDECEELFCSQCTFVAICEKCGRGVCENCSYTPMCGMCHNCYCEGCHPMSFCDACDDCYCQHCHSEHLKKCAAEHLAYWQLGIGRRFRAD